MAKDPMDIDNPEGTNDSAAGPNENSIIPYPVSKFSEGKGLPYAPVNFPKHGDTWSWRVGLRVTSTHFSDRYLIPPSHLPRPRDRKDIASMKVLKSYFAEHFLGRNLKDFLASFSWNIIAKPEVCKAGNKSCSSLDAVEGSSSELMSCDICCVEPNFCRECCCIICIETIDEASSGVESYIRCNAKIKGSTCGHKCHVECALQACLAGTVEDGGTSILDAEFYCRICESRTDMVSYVQKLLKNCESIASRVDVERNLNVGVRILCESKKPSAKELLCQIESAMSKLKNGTDLDAIWKKKGVSPGGMLPNVDVESGYTNIGESRDCEPSPPPLLCSNYDQQAESLKLEDEVDQVLDELKMSQAAEYEQTRSDKRGNVEAQGHEGSV